jgi:hypothetical protein
MIDRHAPQVLSERQPAFRSQSLDMRITLFRCGSVLPDAARQRFLDRNIAPPNLLATVELGLAPLKNLPGRWAE